MLKPVLVTPPSANDPVVTLAMMKSHLRVDHTHEDALIQSMIDSAVASLDGPSGDLNIALVDQSWKIELAHWPSTIRLPLFPVSAITHIKYYDTSNVQRTWSADNYSLHSDFMGAFVRYGYNVQPPSLYIDRADNIEVQFVAGYGAAAAVPAPLKSAVMLLAADLYHNRESYVTGTIVTKIPEYLMRLVSRYNRVGA